MNYQLLIQPPEGDAFAQGVDRNTLVLGRAPTADVVIADRYLSRHHARVHLHLQELQIEDLQSRNGTYVNGLRIQAQTSVSPGDVIQISETVIHVKADDESDRADVSGENMIFKPATDLLRTREFATGSAWQLDDSQLRGYVERLELLNEIHEALGTSMTLDDLLQLILERVFQLLRPQQAVIFLKDGDGTYRMAAKRVQQGLPGEVPLSQSLVTEVAEKGMAALVFDMATDKRFSAAESIQTAGIRSLVAAPLQDATGSLGFIVLSSKVVVRQFSEDDMSLLASLASVAALKIRNAALSEEAAMRRVLEKELNLARTIQVTLIPDRLPKLEGYQVVAKNVPSQAVSGDYYEAVSRRDGQECLLLVADVSGKGVAASLLTASLEALSASPIEDELAPNEICSKLSRLLIRRTSSDRYATMFIAAVDLPSGRLTFSNAGHNPALVVRADGDIQYLERTGLPIGLLPIFDYELGEVQLQSGDLLLIYTDGLTEARNPQGDEFEGERLANVCRKHRLEPLLDVASAIESELTRFVDGMAFDDDRTYILIRRD